MTYVGDRVAYDADSHVHEPPGWLDELLEPDIADRAQKILEETVRWDRDAVMAKVNHQEDAEFRSHDADEIMLRKGFDAVGAFRSEDRVKALNLLGFGAQMVFSSSALRGLTAANHGDDPDLAYGLARAQNRWMVDFCSADSRLLPACYVPFIDVERAGAFTTEALELGAAALLIDSACPPMHSPSHIGFDRVWAQAQEARVPVVFHVGGGLLMDPTYALNGLPRVKDFTGGDGTLNSLSYMALAGSPMQTLSALIIDGVLERFPSLRFGVIEHGASWLPGLMWSLDSAADAFSKNEDRLHQLSLLPSEYIQRQVRVTPYPNEPTGRIIELTGPDVCMFSTDYPHIEGGRNPLKRFDDNIAGRSDEEKRRFYVDNFADLMGGKI